LLSYYEKIKKEVETEDNAKFEISNKQLKQHIRELKKGLEQITKHFNNVSSGNVKKRNEINTLRKERTLYDHIFKTLEYQILDQEKRLFDLIEQNQDKEAIIKENESNLTNITELVSRNKYEDFYKIIDEEKRKYMQDLISLKNNTEEHNVVVNHQPKQTVFNFSKKLAIKHENDVEKFASKTREEDEIFEINNQIKFYEELFAEFRLSTVSEDIDLIEKYISEGDELNENLYKEFIELENRYEELRHEHDLVRENIDKQDKKTISTAVTNKNQEHANDSTYDDSEETLNALIVK